MREERGREGSVFWEWALLAAGTGVLVPVLLLVRLPAAWLLGSLLAGVVVGVGGGRIRLPRSSRVAAQAVIGCMIAARVTPEFLERFARQWPVYLGVTVSTLLASSVLGFVLARRGLLPGTTAIWGLSPGGASTMMLLAEAHGGDHRLVAFMQYLRVLCVAVLASLVGRGAAGSGGLVAGALRDSGPGVSAVITALLIAGAGLAISRLARLRSGPLMVPLFLGAGLQAAGLVRIDLPRWLLLGTFVVLGWGVGLQFTRAGLAHAARSIPWVLGSILLLMAFCGAVAWILHSAAGTDLLTAYLATSPGGVDAAAVIAAATNADLSFVMGQQTVRAVLVMIVGPALARGVARGVAGGLPREV